MQIPSSGFALGIAALEHTHREALPEQALQVVSCSGHLKANQWLEELLLVSPWAPSVQVERGEGLGLVSCIHNQSGVGGGRTQSHFSRIKSHKVYVGEKLLLILFLLDKFSLFLVPRGLVKKTPDGFPHLSILIK